MAEIEGCLGRVGKQEWDKVGELPEPLRSQDSHPPGLPRMLPTALVGHQAEVKMRIEEKVSCNAGQWVSSTHHFSVMLRSV